MKARDNPFSSDRILSIRYRLQGLTWDELMRRLADMDYRCALIGPQGSGKTTLLEDLEPALLATGFRTKWLRLNQSTRRLSSGSWKTFLSTIEETDIILFDGAEQMNCLAWEQFKRRSRKAAGLIITTHRSGRLPTLLECVTYPDLLEEIVRALTSDGAPERLQLTKELFERHKGNLRNALRELYDLHAAS
jgi:hypothetical protein